MHIIITLQDGQNLIICGDLSFFLLQTSLFTDCSCVPDGTASAGSCPMDCPYLIPFLVLTAALLFPFAAGNTPFNILTLK